jgi:hypothetical protein
VFHVWLGLTVIWSTFARHSLPEIVALIMTTLFGLYLAESFVPNKFWWIVAGAMVLGVGLSWFSVTRLWEGAVNLQMDYWQGIYGNRNSLAPVASVALLAVFGIVLGTSRSRWWSQPRMWLAYLLLSVMALFSLMMLWRSRSQTSPIALGVSVSAVLIWLVIKAIVRHLPAPIPFLKSPTQVTFVTLGSALYFSLRSIGNSSAVSSDIATFNSRRALWSVNWSGFLEKPLQGWGWMAARVSPEFFKQGTWWAALETQWSHSGYHDLLLGGGVLAAILFTALVLSSAKRFDDSEISVVIPYMALLVFVLTAATQESFFVGSHFLWALLIATLASRQNYRTSVQEDSTSQRTT